MRFLIFVVAILFCCCTLVAQSKLDNTLKKFNKESVPYIYPEHLSPSQNMILLDTRKKEEFEISHLKNAIWVGHKKFNAQKFAEQFPDKSKPMVVYCSIGVRSENIGEELLAMGYKDVQNLYGGIFEWKNQDGKVYNQYEKETDSVHAFNKHWGKLLTKGEKVYSGKK
ncbi:rhodanese-like domain-containing protein [Maribacter sp. 2210JD10-5]|uniref:rhodanese-like domain-containing protein n=1 Tax=Maribacter sp. 2210JD10-5 TaxID=3386272 RepID=UPI0039BCB164